VRAGCSTPVRLLADRRLRTARPPAAVLLAEGADVLLVLGNRPGRVGNLDARLPGVPGGRVARFRAAGFRADRLRAGRLLPCPHRGRRYGGPGRRGRGRFRAAGRADHFQGLTGRRLRLLLLPSAVGPGDGRPGRRRRRAGHGGTLDRHTTREGRDSHGDQERCGGRRSMHARNSAGSDGLWTADERRMPRTGDLRPHTAGSSPPPLTSAEVTRVTRGVPGVSLPSRRRGARGPGRRGRCGGRTPRSCGCRSSAG